ncbi:carboxymuconolactone decarboxylase family protein [Streptomyces aureocirculatus]|uniref:carboxymuconolactone decarboxylase family protein n=1 Tax=Streptomyces aureocirculatus TaxID=67275 RepID=UPI0004C4B324|nr:carboxymuconolactone decarboxylase family protein [Streptomyces aureocirculatus]
MDNRLDFFSNPVSGSAVKHLAAAGRTAVESTVPAATLELAALRISQINGCGYCVDMHTKNAAHAGESQQRLNLVAVWREATVFTDAERAALELAEQGTAFNRLNVITQRAAGDYKVGQLG